MIGNPDGNGILTCRDQIGYVVSLFKHKGQRAWPELFGKQFRFRRKFRYNFMDLFHLMEMHDQWIVERSFLQFKNLGNGFFAVNVSGQSVNGFGGDGQNIVFLQNGYRLFQFIGTK